MLTEHVPDTRVQVPPCVKVTVPDGVIAVPGEVSVTVAVQLVAWLITRVDGAQATAVFVLRLLTVTVALPVLVLWAVSPL